MRSKLSLGILLGCTIVAACIGPSLGQVKPSTSVTYINRQYGFEFRLPPSWRGYKVITEYCPEEYKDCVKARPKGMNTGYISITLRHPRWNTTHQRQDIPIMVCPLTAWPEVEDWQYGAAPVGPDELARNSRFVFAVPPRFDVGDRPGNEEVEHIMMGNPLHAF